MGCVCISLPSITGTLTNGNHVTPNSKIVDPQSSASSERDSPSFSNPDPSSRTCKMNFPLFHLVRHGESFGNIRQQTRENDDELTPKGETQAVELSRTMLEYKLGNQTFKTMTFGGTKTRTRYARPITRRHTGAPITRLKGFVFSAKRTTGVT